MSIRQMLANYLPVLIFLTVATGLALVADDARVS